MEATEQPRRRHRGIARFAKTSATLAAVLVACWAIGLVGFARMAGELPSPGLPRADAIVVLTGGSERLPRAFTLLDQDRANRIFISGVHETVGVPDLLALMEREFDEKGPRIHLGYQATDTVGNAIETADWVHSENINSMWLVTSNYHMPRSLLEFRQVLPHTDIRPYPVAPPTVHMAQWWRWPGTARLVVMEYNKYLYAMARLQISAMAGGLVPSPDS